MEQTHGILNIWQNCDEFYNTCFVGERELLKVENKQIAKMSKN